MADRGGESDGVGVVLDLVVVLVVAAALLVVSFGPLSVPRWLELALAVVAVFLPGYALVAALFTRRPSTANDQHFAERVRRPDGFERVVLAVATGSVAAPLLGIALNFSPWLVRRRAVHATLLGFVLVTSLVAAVRRFRLPSVERYTPARRWLAALGGLVDGRRGREVDLVTVAVAVAVVVAAAGVFTVASTAQTGEEFTEFAVLSGAEGRLVAGEYPENVTASDPVAVELLVENREGERASYTVVTMLQRLTETESGTRVSESETFQRVNLTVDSGRVERFDHAVTPTMTGARLRLAFLLYRGPVPDNPRLSNAYRHTHVWLNVSG